ncbi:hypothetical protein RHABOEDO_000035 [Candidatus Rhabdochlamydia oedothoracis]|uniref:Uncharacterized protein n=1 Tax=Candidatus Rhabdochlamydia oedothoracis TaxID=2720720 RepID=A0ABX8V4J8_9BACT|nr:hypothetical protein [Candidatus Rhabdochlamydia oedothoracis]MCL6756729.1 hypothetical protein [Candidatus Rhabdochlamydia oedothoracis]QYF47963.1 hypothetical protein RHABOEDO_000035 [Candidatus Rhabdochlamydia oedothoracis]
MIYSFLIFADQTTSEIVVLDPLFQQVGDPGFSLIKESSSIEEELLPFEQTSKSRDVREETSLHSSHYSCFS